MSSYRIKKVTDANGTTTYQPQDRCLGLWWPIGNDYFHDLVDAEVVLIRAKEYQNSKKLVKTEYLNYD